MTFPIMALLAFGSGVAALIYEIVWFQLLELIIGSSAVSLAVLLAAFMGGMCLGSLLIPRLIPARYNPLRIYAFIELGIAVLAVLLLLLTSAARLPGFLVRSLVTAGCLLPPTFLMGATLPLLSRSIETTKAGISWLGLFYGSNIAGAVFGCLLSGFYLLRQYDITTATYIAAAVNAIGAAIAFSVAGTEMRGHGLRKQGTDPSRDNDRIANLTPVATEGLSPVSSAHDRAFSIYLAIALSGMCAMAAEVLWTRSLGLLFGASVYALSIILAVFLTGLGIGSSIGSWLSRTLLNPRMSLGWFQLLAAAGIAWSAYNLGASLPYWPVNPSLSSNILFNFQLDLARAFWALLPATLVWGASFPLALAAAGLREDSARLMAEIYSANTLGAIVGAVVTSLLFITWIGPQRTEQVLIAVSALAGLSVLLPIKSRRASGILAAVVAGFAALLIAIVPSTSRLLIAHGRYAATWVGKSDIVYAREGLNSSVAVSQFPDGTRTFHVAGKIQASTVARDMRLQRMLGHLTTLLSAKGRSVLVIGCGAGVTAGAVSIDPRVEHLTIAEIEPLVPEAAANYFAAQNFDVLHNPKTQVHIDDGRHYLLSTEERFDAITADPLDPWVKGAANLYTKEFLEAARRHLEPGGVVTMYMQLFENNLEAVKSAAGTFFEVFPNGTIWGNTYQGQGHDLVLLGQIEPLHVDLDEIEGRLQSPEFTRVRQSLAEVGMNSAVDLFSTYAGRGSDLAEWLKGSVINTDRNLRMQYLAGIGLNLDDSASIYAELLKYRHFPTDIFTGSPAQLDSLHRNAFVGAGF